MELSDQIKKAGTRRLCPVCNAPGDSVQIRTVYHHVMADYFQRIEKQDYWFCNSASCDVVYFGQIGEPFYIQEVREIVSIKHRQASFPLCYCFGFNSNNISRTVQLETQKASTVIRNLISAGLCECEIRNPAGKCCLGAVLSFEKTMRRD